jgi:hypothetical protein
MRAVSCPSAALCVGAVTELRLTHEVLPGNVWWPQRELIATSTEPASPDAWAVDPSSAPDLNSITCPSPTLCVGTIAKSEVALTTDPLGGTGTWSSLTVPGDKTLTWITCPSEWLCVASDSTGDLLTWTDPGTPAQSWTIQHVADFIEPPSCISTSLCVALTQDGRIVVGAGAPGSYEDGAAAASRATTSTAGARVAITCHGTSTDRCRLTLALTFLAHGPASNAGVGYVDVRAGRRALTRVPLTATARHRLSTHHKLRLRLTVTATTRSRARIVSTQVLKLTGTPRRHH